MADYTDLKKHIIIAAVERHGMSWANAEHELESYLKGNRSTYTARIQAIIKSESYGVF